MDSSTEPELDDFGGGDLCLVGDPALAAARPGLFFGGRPGERFGGFDFALSLTDGDGGCLSSALVLMMGDDTGGTSTLAGVGGGGRVGKRGVVIGVVGVAGGGALGSGSLPWPRTLPESLIATKRML